MVADGLGGYAMGTVSGLRTRRYHGLLITATEPPIGRRLGLAALDPVLVAGDRRIRLATHEWSGGAVDPRGHVHLDWFELDGGVPRWRWSSGGIVLEAEVAMTRGRSAVGVRHRLVAAPSTVRLEVHALCTWRDIHGERFASEEPSVDTSEDGFAFEDAYRVRGPGFEPGGAWFRNVHHRDEADRGLNAVEDLWHAGHFAADLAPGAELEVEAWAGDLTSPVPHAGAIIAAARARTASVTARAKATDTVDAMLAVAADHLVVAGPTIVAGYPWFGDWSRDTMTSYEGAILETGRDDEGRELLVRAAGSVSEGMLANTADAGGTEFNTVDGTLWFLHAVGRHVERTGDVDLGVELLPTLQSIIDHHVGGTRFGIRVDSDGLVTQGADGWALTWMDARVDGEPITARRGKPVEVNALWIRGLSVVAALTARDGGDTVHLRTMEAAARRAFASRFVRPDGSGLFDVVDSPDGDDASVRPNQLLAVSLPGSPLADASSVVNAVEPLVTSIGIRSLSPLDPRYVGRHRGGPSERDAAYHQGTVWLWLIGPYVDAVLAAGDGHAPEDLLSGLDAHVTEYGLGSVSETADGDAPHAATGCPFQAWSVAELLRARHLLREHQRGSSSM
jgi:predicted glycogen debranching enzyme